MPPIYARKLLFNRADYAVSAYNVSNNVRAVLVNGEENPLNSHLLSSITSNIISSSVSVGTQISNGRVEITSGFVLQSTADTAAPYLFFYDSTSEKLLVRYKLFDVTNTEIFNTTFLTFSSNDFPFGIVSMQASVVTYHADFLNLWWSLKTTTANFFAQTQNASSYNGFLYHVCSLASFPAPGEPWTLPLADLVSFRTTKPTATVSGSVINLSSATFAGGAAYTYNAIVLAVWINTIGYVPVFFYRQDPPVAVALNAAVDIPATIAYWE